MDGVHSLCSSDPQPLELTDIPRHADRHGATILCTEIQLHVFSGVEAGHGPKPGRGTVSAKECTQKFLRGSHNAELRAKLQETGNSASTVQTPAHRGLHRALSKGQGRFPTELKTGAGVVRENLRDRGASLLIECLPDTNKALHPIPSAGKRVMVYSNVRKLPTHTLREIEAIPGARQVKVFELRPDRRDLLLQAVLRLCMHVHVTKSVNIKQRKTERRNKLNQKIQI